MFTVKNNQPEFDPMSENEFLDSLIVSLMVHGRATPDETPEHLKTQGGYWGDQLDTPVGSKLWVLEREAQTDDVLAMAKIFATESLRWVDESASVLVQTNYKEDVLELEIHIDGEVLTIEAI